MSTRPEDRARQNIDRMLEESGWVVQDRGHFNLRAGRGVAIRVLFLVDRANLARQTLNEFQQYQTPDDGRKFTELYNVQHLQSNSIDRVANVCITTIQRMYSILSGEAELDPENEERSLFEDEEESEAHQSPHARPPGRLRDRIRSRKPPPAPGKRALPLLQLRRTAQARQAQP